MWLVNQSTDLLDIVLASTKVMSAISTLGQIVCIRYKGQKEACASLVAFAVLWVP